MALLSVDYFSAALMRTTTFEVILPIDGSGDAFAADHELRFSEASRPGEPYPYPRPHAPFPVLFLLHGMTGNHTDWVSSSPIRALAERRGVAVVMPSGYNAFYLDQPDSHNYYGRFVGEELVAVARAMFPLSRRRDQTFIGGISMGAYGALRNGLLQCETFGSVIGLSTAIISGGFDQVLADEPFFLSKPFLESAFGPLDQVRGGDKDPARLAADLVYCDRPRPRVFMACGQADPLLAPGRELAQCLRDTGLDVTWREGPGGHDWDFWNAQLPQALDWLPRAGA